MKRSRSIKLTLMGAATFFMTACDNHDVGRVDFKSSQQCLEFYDADQCQKIVKSAIPSFSSKEECQGMMGAECTTQILPSQQPANTATSYVPLFLNHGGTVPANSPWANMSPGSRENFIKNNSAGFAVNSNNVPSKFSRPPSSSTVPPTISTFSRGNLTTPPTTISRSGLSATSRSGFGSSGRAISAAS